MLKIGVTTLANQWCWFQISECLFWLYEKKFRCLMNTEKVLNLYLLSDSWKLRETNPKSQFWDSGNARVKEVQNFIQSPTKNSLNIGTENSRNIKIPLENTPKMQVLVRNAKILKLKPVGILLILTVFLSSNFFWDHTVKLIFDHYGSILYP